VIRIAGRTVSEKILSTKAGQEARAGDIVMCSFDWAIGTDGSAPMAIDYFARMGGERVANPERIMFSLDHYAPPASAQTAHFHDLMRAFARANGIDVRGVGEGISHQMAVELGRVLPGGLVVGADSHTLMCGALNAFGTGIGSSDLAAAMISGEVWLRVPHSVRVTLDGSLRAPATAKDAMLALLEELGGEGGNYLTLEFHGPGVGSLSVEDRMVLSSMATETGAKAAIFPFDRLTATYLAGRTSAPVAAVDGDPDAEYVREIVLDLSELQARVALPHHPDHVVPAAAAVGTPVHMVFIGTCTGGRASDVRKVHEVLESAGGIAAGVQLVITPASREVFLELTRDGTLAGLAEMGATVTTPGCGPCCGTSGPIPGDGMNVISTANRNFKGRMGNGTAAIYLASPVTCAAAAAAGRIVDPEEGWR
jgi:3-isopropylmalate/(R)-2-methylmalate dehydratase large subunit